MLGRSVPLVLDPTHQLARVDANPERVEYISEGDDPRFAIDCEGGLGRVQPGWHVFSARIHVLEGRLAAPCLYPDYGEGFSEATAIALPEPEPDGTLRAVLVFKGRLRALRFDPAIHVARFVIEGISLKRVSRAWAVAEMLNAIRVASPERNWRVPMAALRSLVAHAVRGRLAAGADRLVGQYLALHRMSTRCYPHWLKLFSAPSAPGEAGPDADGPRFSIVLPVHNPPLSLLRECLDSVLAQTCPHWELCIADDASNAAVRAVLREYAARDARIRLDMSDVHSHICRTTNRALAMATGRYVAFLDHDDRLAADALAEVANAFRQFPSARLAYTDEDKIGEDGERHSPHFKPAWNPDLLRSQNYICHFLVIEAALVREVGGLRPGFEGAQDHDLVLRCTERLVTEQIVHIPRVLYHWRMLPGSTALGVGEKSYAVEAGRRAVAEHLARTGCDATVDVLPAGYFRITRALPAKPPRVSIVIPTRDRLPLLRSCVESIAARTDYPDYEVVIVDNGSTEPAALHYLQVLQASGCARVIDYPAPFNFSDIANRGIRAAGSDVVCLLNNDIEVINADWLCEMVSHALRPEVGVVGAMLYYPDSTIQHAGVILGLGGVAGHGHVRLQRGADGYVSRARVVQNLSAVTGACMVFRRDVFDRVGGFDESLPVAFNDIDFCIKAGQQGYLNVWTPFAELYHHESASRGHEDTPEKRTRFDMEVDRMRRRWGDLLASDPAYNPNLALDAAPFDLAFPPRKPESRVGRLSRAA